MEQIPYGTSNRFPQIMGQILHETWNRFPMKRGTDSPWNKEQIPHGTGGTLSLFGGGDTTPDLAHAECKVLLSVKRCNNFAGTFSSKWPKRE